MLSEKKENYTACLLIYYYEPENKYGIIRFCSVSWYVIYGVLLFFLFFNGNKCYSYIFVWRTLVIPEELHLFLFFYLMKN